MLETNNWLMLPLDNLRTHRGTAQTYLQRHFVPNNDQKASEMTRALPPEVVHN